VFWEVSWQTAPYSPELEPDIVLTQPHASGVDETCTPLVIAEGGSIPLHWMAELIAFSTWGSYGEIEPNVPPDANGAVSLCR
jgi:hypothetical protein